MVAALLAAPSIVLAPVHSSRERIAATDADDPPKTAATKPDSRVIQLDADGQQKAGIAAAVPAHRPYQDVVQVYGSVLPLDRLTSLYNASLTDDAQLAAAQAKQTASRLANDRARELLKVFPTAKAQAEATEGTYEVDTAALSAAKAQIEALRNTAVQDWGPVLGESIAKRSELAQGLVHRKTALVQMSWHPGLIGKAPPRLSFGLGSGAVEGRLVSEAAQIDPKIQGASYLYAVPTTDGMLPGSSIVAYLSKGEARPGYDVPSSAVVWQAGKAWMYVRVAPETFERRAIGAAATPTPDGGFVVPATSLLRGRPVVVGGAQVLLSQEMRAQIPSDEDDN